MLAYDIVDVFADRPFTGNQLAVVHGGESLDTQQCLAITREFGYSETTFPSTSVRGTEYSTRIFTPGGEIPFAGHPTLGTAWVLRSRGLLPAVDQATQVCAAGRIEVRFTGDLVELSAPPRDLAGPLDDGLVASLLDDVGLSAGDLAGPAWAAGCGITFVHLPVQDRALARARVSARPLAEYQDRFLALGTADPVEGVNLVQVSGTAPRLSVRARVFVPGLSVPEDAATGAAAVGLGLALVASGTLPEGGRYEISQGVELGRPSRLLGSVDAVDGAPDRCRVAGQVHPIARGEIAVPATG